MAKEKNNHIFAAAFSTTALLLLFKLLAFAKQAVIAGYFGTSDLMDSYFSSIGFVEEISYAIVRALSVSTLAEYARVKIRQGKPQASQLVGSMFSALAILSVGVVGLLQILAPQVSRLLAPGYGDQQLATLTFFLRISSLSFGFSAVKTLGESVLDAEKCFIIPRLQSLIRTCSVIGACVLFSGWLSAYSLVAGQYLSDILYCGLLLWNMRRYVTLRLCSLTAETRKIFRLALPLMLGTGIMNINQIVDRAIATGVGVGAVSALSYSQVLIQLITSVLVANVANVLYAHFSDFAARGQENIIRDTLTKTLNILVYVLVPISLLALLYAEDIVKIVYYRGAFTLESVDYTAALLRGYALGFLFTGIQDILTNSMYAYQDTRSPMINGAAAVGLNIGISLLLARILGIAGIALGTTLSTAVVMALNMKSFRKSLPDFSYRPVGRALLRSLPAAAALCTTVYLLKFLPLGSLASFILAAAVNLPLYFVILYFCGAEELHMGVQSVRKKLHP